jgi:uncharacterized membrane protein YfcA
VPIIHYIAGWPMVEALLVSLTMVWMVSLGSSLAHSGEGHANKIAAKAGRITAVPGAVIGTLFAWLAMEYVSVLLIKIFAAAVLIFVIERNLRTSQTVSGGGDFISKYKASCAFGGITSGLLGIGGGAIYVTINRRIAGFDSRTSAGTSYLIEAVVVPVALFSHLLVDGSLGDVLEKTGYIAAIVVPALAFGSAYFGAKNAFKYLPTHVVKWVFIAAVSVSLGRYLWDIFSRLL